MFLRRLASLLSSEVFSIWVRIEIIGIRFIGLVLIDLDSSSSKFIIKYFLLQRASGLIILMGLMALPHTRTGLLNLILIFALILKLGAPPLHLWILSVAPLLSVYMLYFLLSFLKLIPLIILSNLRLGIYFFFAITRWGVSFIGRLKSTNLLRLLIYSSIFFAYFCDVL